MYSKYVSLVRDVAAYIKTLSAVAGSIIAQILRLAINRFFNQQSWEIVYPDLRPGLQSLITENTMMVNVPFALNRM
jgi:hypothetical protein